MENLRKDCKLIEVVREGDPEEITLVFFDEEVDCIREVYWKLGVWNDEKREMVKDKEKAAKVAEWSKEYFDLELDELDKAIGVTKDVYVYDRFNSLWEANIINKFTLDNVGEMFSTTISEVTVDDVAIKVAFEYDGKKYEKGYKVAQWNDTLNRFVKNPILRTKSFEKFEKLFGVNPNDADSIIGKEIMVEVKVAFGKFAYADIKKPAWNK